MSNQLAVPAPVIEPSAEEKSAVALMAQISTDGVEARAARLKADATLSTLTSEPTPVPTFIMRTNEVEVEKLRAEISVMQRRKA